ncbi:MULTISPECIES: hypothetical protein [Kitasatospora]|uniref:Uncharacterized protein n=1 Tax=Kitasatospora setae (strain ATCC 33774 / DSM 43861 / JCM 3304 / KCC A-0304 / NBRC 14216 / KM-6054) TaxID=452652 RepID=E4N3R3_KITSK|nr:MULTISPECIES: hypothetical protein [Kitasatospora]BAJ31544.1 hypothetical protein KSE_57710 [Kitasatospora setae KM-6054]
MATHRTKALTATAAAGAALLLGAALAQPAAAVELPRSAVAYFATGSNLTGTQYAVDTADTGCHNLPAAARSAVDFTAANIQVFFNADCATGLPGKTGSGYYALGSLHWADFPYPAVSYRVTG